MVFITLSAFCSWSGLVISHTVINFTHASALGLTFVKVTKNTFDTMRKSLID